MKKIKKLWAKLNPEPRPYWFVDAKWIFGILFVISFTLTLWFYNYSQLLSRDNIVNNISNEYENYLKDKVQSWNLGNGGIQKLRDEIKQVRDKLKNAADKAQKYEGIADDINTQKSEIIPGLDLSTEKDQLNKYTRDVESLLYNKIVQILDNSRVDEVLDEAVALEEKLPDELDIKETVLTGIKQKIIQSIDFPTIYNEQSHDNAKKYFWIFLSCSIIMLLGVVFFSCGFGRLFVPGLVILISTGPGCIILNDIYRYLSVTPLNNLANSRIELISKLAEIIIQAKNDQLDVLTQVHLVPLIIGAVLFVSGLILQIVYSVKKKKRKRKRK